MRPRQGGAAMSTPVQKAAAAIVALINASPRSPRQEEIEAIIAKVASAEPSASPVALSPEHRKYRELLAEIAKFEEPGYADGEEGDAAFAAQEEEEMALERQIWSKPAETLADVLLRGEIALYNENGIMESLNEREAYQDERAAAQLIRAVNDVLGGLCRG